MAVGYRNSAGFDFDNLFQPGSTSLPGFRRSDGSNLRYAARGTTAKLPDVGFRDALGQDVTLLWMAKGLVPPVLGFNGQSYFAGSQAPTGATAAPRATLTLTLAPSGAWTIVRFITGSVGGNGQVTVASGTWLPSGSSAGGFEVQYLVGGSGPGQVSNGAATFSGLATARSLQLSVSAAAASGDNVQDSRTVTCLLRRIGQDSSSSVCTFNCSATGYL